MKIKLIDKYDFSKVIEIESKLKVVNYGTIEFKLSHVPKRGLPVFKQISDL